MEWLHLIQLLSTEQSPKQNKFFAPPFFPDHNIFGFFWTNFFFPPDHHNHFDSPNHHPFRQNKNLVGTKIIFFFIRPDDHHHNNLRFLNEFFFAPPFPHTFPNNIHRPLAPRSIPRQLPLLPSPLFFSFNNIFPSPSSSSFLVHLLSNHSFQSQKCFFSFSNVPLLRSAVAQTLAAFYRWEAFYLSTLLVRTWLLRHSWRWEAQTRANLSKFFACSFAALVPILSIYYRVRTILTVIICLLWGWNILYEWNEPWYRRSNENRLHPNNPAAFGPSHHIVSNSLSAPTLHLGLFYLLLHLDSSQSSLEDRLTFFSNFSHFPNEQFLFSFFFSKNKQKRLAPDRIKIGIEKSRDRLENKYVPPTCPIWLWAFSPVHNMGLSAQLC